MADWVSSLLAGLGAGAESLGTSMTEREKRNAAAKQRAFELAMQQADKNAELGITDIAPRLPSESALTKMSDTIGRIGALGKPQSMDMLSDQLRLRSAVGGQVQKFTTPSPDFSIGGPTPDMSDAATNYEVSRTGASTFGSRPTSPRFDNFTNQTVAPAASPRTVSAVGTPTMPRTRLGSIPDVQSQLPAPSMTTGGADEGASTIMQYNPLHPEAGPIRKQIDYRKGTDYLAMQARQDAEEKKVIAERKALADLKRIDDRDARRGDHVTLQTLTTTKMPKAMYAIATKNFNELTPEEIQALPALSTLAKTLAAQASAKELAAIAAAPGRDAASEQRRFNRESTLSKEYEANRVVKDARLVGEAVQAVQASAQQNTPASDIAMLYNVVKLLDPASAVREGEINLQLAARSLGTRFTAAWTNATKGNKMTPEERNNIVAMLEPRVNGIRAQVAPIQQTFGRRAAMYGADSSAVAPDPLAGVSVGRPSGFRLPPTRK